MPLTKTGDETKAAMIKQYGAKKGEQVFYASENKGIAGSSKWTKKKKKKMHKGHNYSAEAIKTAKEKA